MTGPMRKVIVVMTTVLLLAGPGSLRAQSDADAPAADAPAADAPAKAAPPKRDSGLPTPIKDRVAELVVLDKQTGRRESISLKPGQVITVRSLSIVLQTCETTPPWQPQESGAFVQIDKTARDGTARRIYSGWMYAQARSLNPLEDPGYDVWLASCAMRFPDSGPDTVVVGDS